jgi:parallel beta-helix repeat protein
MPGKCIAFLSYAHDDDDTGDITKLRQTLERRIRKLTGWKDFQIFQDKSGIEPGKIWREVIESSLDEVFVLIPIVTPNWFNSKACRGEVQRFVDREDRLKRDDPLKRNDLILPVYLIRADALDNKEQLQTDAIAQQIEAHQWVDWRDLDVEDLATPPVRKRVHAFAEQVRDRLIELKHATAARPRPVHQPDPPLEPQSAKRKSVEQPPSSGTPGRPLARKEAEFRHELPPARFVPVTPQVADLAVDLSNQPAHRRTYRSLQEAIAAAVPGEIIAVKPGTHQGPVTVERDVTIIGDGEPGHVIIECDTGPVLTVDTPAAHLVNLTLRQTAIGEAVLVIAQGSSEIEECDVSGRGAVCIAVRRGATPVLRFNTIHDGATGIAFERRSGGTADSNHIYSLTGNGVETGKGARPLLRRNMIRDTDGYGVYVQPLSRPRLEFNEIKEAAKAGVHVDGAQPLVWRNLVHDCATLGIEVARGGSGRIVANDVYANGGAGVEITDNSDPVVLRNRIHGGKGAGVVVRNGGKGKFKHNDIFGNARANVEIRDRGDPHLCFNVIYFGAEYGIFVHTAGRGTIEKNEIHRNQFAGVEIMTEADPVVRNNAIHNGPWGVLVREGGKGTIENNDLFLNGSAGVCSREERSKPTVRTNRIFHNKSYGIKLERGGGTFEDNRLWRNKRSDWDPPQPAR